MRKKLSTQYWSRLPNFRWWGARFSVGMLDQAILSGTSFVFTIALAKTLDVREFGWFSIAWSYIMLVDSIFASLFGDAAPATAHKLAKAYWPQLRSSFYFWSAVLSGGACVLTIILALVAWWANVGIVELLVASAFLIPAVRLKEMFRRMCYLEGYRSLAVVSSIAYAFTLFVAFGCMIITVHKSAASSIMCLTAASATSAAFAFSGRFSYAKPTQRLAKWCIQRLWHSGRWIIVGSISFWISTIGIIPLSGYLFGLEFSGTLRILQNLLAPLTQLNTGFATVLLPNAAERLRTKRRADLVRIAQMSVALFGIPSLIYGVAITVGGTYLADLFFHDKAFMITTFIIAVMAIGSVSDSVRQGVGLAMFAMGATRGFFLSRIVSLLVLVVMVPITTPIWGFPGLLTAMVIANISATVIMFMEIIKISAALKA